MLITLGLKLKGFPRRNVFYVMKDNTNDAPDYSGMTHTDVVNSVYGG